MLEPNITRGQIAIDPRNGVLFYKDGSGNLMKTTLSFNQDTYTDVSTDDAVTFSSNVIIDGNLTVNGDTVTVNAAQLYVEDNIIILNSNIAESATPTLDAGIEINRGNLPNVSIRWNETLNRWEYTNDGFDYNAIGSGGGGGGSAEFLNDIGDVATGSAVSGEYLKFNGTYWVNASIQLGTNTSGNYIQNLVAGTGVVLSNNSGEGSQPTIAIGQDVGTGATPTFGRVIAPLTGNVTGNLTGNVTGNLTGDVNGNVTGIVSDISNHTINELSDVVISGETNGDFLRYQAGNWINDAVNLSTDTVGDYVKNLVAGTGITLTNNSGEGSTPNISIGQSVGTTDTVTFSVVNADLTGDVTGTVSDISNHGISDLSDVNITDPADGNFLRYDGSNWFNDPVNLATDTIGDYVAKLAAGTGITISNNSGEGATPNISIGQAVGTSNTVTFAGVTAPLTGNVTGNLTGDVTGDVTGTVSDISNHGISDLSDVNINDPADGNFLRYQSGSWINDAVNLATDTIGDYVAKLSAGHGITITNNFGEGATPNISVTSTTVVSDTIPTGAQQGDIWYESDSGKTFVYYDSFWVEVSSPTNPQIGTSSFAAIATDLLPSADDQYTLGSEDYRWRDIFLGPGTIHITDQVTDEDVTLSVSDGVLQIDGANQLNVGQIKFVNNNIESIFGSTDINIGTISDTGFLNINRPLSVSNSSNVKVFNINRNGYSSIRVPNPITGEAVLNISGNTSSAIIPLVTTATGGIIHLTGGVSGPTLTTVDNFDNVSPTANSGTIIFRRLRGTVDTPAPIQLNDRIGLIAAAGYGATSGNYNSAGFAAGAYSSISFRAAENHTLTAHGSKIEINAIPNGSTVPATYLLINPNSATPGISLPVSGTGILFPDNSFQTTAYVGSNPLGHWGAFSDTSNQLINNAATTFPVKFNTTDGSNGVSVQNDLSGNKTRITVANAGVYNIQFSLQLDKTDGNDDLVNIWLSKNGTNVPNSNTQVTVLGNGGKMVAAWNLVLQLTAGQYVQLMCQSPDTAMRIIASGEQSSPARPAVPSAILTVTQVA